MVGAHWYTSLAQSSGSGYWTHIRRHRRLRLSLLFQVLLHEEVDPFVVNIHMDVSLRADSFTLSIAIETEFFSPRLSLEVLYALMCT